METLQQQLPSPTSHSSSCSSSNSNGNATPATVATSPRPVLARSEPANPYPTTFVQADTASFKQVVQMLTGSPRPAAPPPVQPEVPPGRPAFSIPPIKSIPKKTQPSSGFKLYERRNSLKNLKINPLNPIGHGFSPRKPEILSPSILDFPSLVLSPVTPLIPDPFDRSSSGCVHPQFPQGYSGNSTAMEAEAEEKAIKEKGFYLHRSPATTPREGATEPPRLLPLFPVSSPRGSGSNNLSS